MGDLLGLVVAASSVYDDEIDLRSFDVAVRNDQT